MIGGDFVNLVQDSFDGKAILTQTRQDDFIERGFAFNIQRIVTGIAVVGTYKIVLDFSGVAVTKKIWILPLNMSATGGPVKITTYAISTYTDGTIIPAAKLNALPTNLITPQAVCKKGITSTDVAGDDLREYGLGATGNPQQVNRSGSAAGLSPLILPAGVKICMEVDNNYSEAIDLTIGIVWDEIPLVY